MSATKVPGIRYCVVVRRISDGDSDCGNTSSMSLHTRCATRREATRACSRLNMRNHSTQLDYDVMTEADLRAAQVAARVE